jgi:hypothetical protein
LIGGDEDVSMESISSDVLSNTSNW